MKNALSGWTSSSVQVILTAENFSTDSRIYKEIFRFLQITLKFLDYVLLYQVLLSFMRVVIDAACRVVHVSLFFHFHTLLLAVYLRNVNGLKE